MPLYNPPARFRVQAATPATGNTVVATADDQDSILWLTPAGTLATLTVTFPANATSRLGQVFGVGSSQIVTALTLNGATTILNTITTLALNGTKWWVKVADNTWAQFGGNV